MTRTFLPRLLAPRRRPPPRSPRSRAPGSRKQQPQTDRPAESHSLEREPVLVDRVEDWWILLAPQRLRVLFPGRSRRRISGRAASDRTLECQRGNAFHRRRWRGDYAEL